MNINGKIYSFASISLSANGLSYSGISEVSYSESVERSKITGTGILPIGRTEGSYSAEGSVTFYRQEFDRFVTANPNLFDVTFDVVVTYSNPGEIPVTDVLKNCKVEGTEMSGSEGSDPLSVPVKLNVMWIERNGKKPFDSSLSGLSASVLGASISLSNAGF